MIQRRMEPAEAIASRARPRRLLLPSSLLLTLTLTLPFVLLAPSTVQAQEAPFLQFPPVGESRNASWSPRSGHTITVVDDAMILIGGWDSVQFFNDVLRWQYAGEDWEPMPLPPFSPRFGHSAVYNAATATLVVIGGLDNSVRGGAALNDVYSSADGGRSWTTLTTLAPFPPRYVAGLASSGPNLWLAGGFPGDPGNVMDLWRSVDGGSQWTDLTRRRAPVSRFGLTLGVAGGQMWLIGGLTTERPFQALNDVWQLDMATGEWSIKDPYPVPSDLDLNQFGPGIEHEGTLVMIGGWSIPQLGVEGQVITNAADHFLQFDGQNFARRPIAPLHPVSFPAVTSFRGSVLVQGGENFDGVAWNEVYVSNDGYAKPRPPRPVSSSSTGAGVDSTGGTGVVSSSSTGASNAVSSTGAAAGSSTGAVAGSSTAAGVSSTAAGVSSTGAGVATASSTGRALSTGRASSTGPPSSAGSSTGVASIFDDIGGPNDGSLNSAVGGGGGGSDRFGSLPEWALILCVVLGALIVACAFCIVFMVRRRRKRTEYELEEKAQIDATLAAQAERERQADLEAQRQKKALALAGGPGARPLAASATKEEKARAEKELRKLTFGGATAAAAVGGGAIAAGASKDSSNKNGGYDQLSDKDSQLSRASEPRSSLVGPPSVTGLHYAGSGHHERSSISLAAASHSGGSSASSTPTVSRRNSLTNHASAPGTATPGSTPALNPGPRPTLASFLSPHDGGLTPVTNTPSAPLLPLAAATAGVGAGATVAAAGDHKQTSPPLQPQPQQYRPPPPPPPQSAHPTAAPPRLAPLTIPHHSPPPAPIVPAPVSSSVPAGPPPPPPQYPPPASAVGPSAALGVMPAPSAPQMDADATHALELPMVLEYNYTFNADE